MGKQRALVFQGGGALGAYEAGVYKVLYDWVSKWTKDDENIFDIIAGTSIGAINGAILVSYVLNNKDISKTKSRWKDSAKVLEDFWIKRIASEPNLWRTDYYLYYGRWTAEREEWLRVYPQMATPEAARRYYSAKEFLYRGARNVFEPEGKFPLYDNKFFDDNRVDDINNIWFRHSNHPLRESLEKYATFPIKTSFTNNEPRFLVISVDVEEGETVTFDSYSEESEYGEYNKESKQYEHHPKYVQGLMPEHVMASACIPLLFDYQWVPNGYDAKARPFWDGGLLSNTPIRELIDEHKLYWEKQTIFRTTSHGQKTLYQIRTEENKDKREQYYKELFEILWKEMSATTRRTAARRLPREGEGQPVPLVEQPWSGVKADDLDVYIVNLWPTEEKPFPQNDDYDLTKDRVIDIINHDKTEYDLKVATFVTDYIDLIRNLVQQLAIDGSNSRKVKEQIQKILLNDSKTKSKFREGMPRKYLDLIIGRFDVTERLRIERTENNENTISNKWTDLSYQTIAHLMEQGRRDTLKQIADKLIDTIGNKDKITSLSDSNRNRLIALMKQIQNMVEDTSKPSSAYEEYRQRFLNIRDEFAAELDALQAKGERGDGLSEEQVAMLKP